MREARTEGLGESHNEGIHNACFSRNIVRRMKVRIIVGKFRSEHKGDKNSVFYPKIRKGTTWRIYFMTEYC
jgi:hypothetical protein